MLPTEYRVINNAETPLPLDATKRFLRRGGVAFQTRRGVSSDGKPGEASAGEGSGRWVLSPTKETVGQKDRGKRSTEEPVLRVDAGTQRSVEQSEHPEDQTADDAGKTKGNNQPEQAFDAVLHSGRRHEQEVGRPVQRQGAVKGFVSFGF